MSTTPTLPNMEPPVAPKPAHNHVVEVAIPAYLPKKLTYYWHAKTTPVENTFATVTVASKTYHALITKVTPAAQHTSKHKLKPAEPLDYSPTLTPQTANFYSWIAKYTLSTPGEPIRAALPNGKIPEPPAPEKLIIRGTQMPDRLTPARQKVLNALGSKSWTPCNLATAAGVTNSVIHGLIKQNALQWQLSQPTAPTPNFAHVTLNDSQKSAASAINSTLNTFQPFLLDGTMGSGKTEVYFDSIEHALKQTPSAQVLLLVPEIALTPQLLNRFKKRFGFAPVLWHSSVSPAQKRKNWWQVTNGTAPIIIGARSALFLPFKNLKLIIVDEEHDSSYKQEDSFRYHGRDMAIALAKYWSTPVVLASATPSLESWNHAQTGKYTHLKLKGRYGNAILPSISLIDLKQDKPAPKNYLSPSLLQAIDSTLQKGQQSLLFLNRRGVAPLLICRDCGHRHDCPSCDASLVVHGISGNGRLTCHHCGFTEPYPETCAKCGSDKLHPFGPGTRKIMQEVQQAFPSARIAVADSDSITTPNQMGELVKRLELHNNDEDSAGGSSPESTKNTPDELSPVDILIGTQMVAKGHHFPHLTLVGVLDADMGLAQGDLRAAERTFQLLMQVAGRAGRAKHKGMVLIQTHQPEHPLMQALEELNRDKFYAQELSTRKPWNDPPFGRQIAIHISGKNDAQTLAVARKLAQNFPSTANAQILGPAPAVIKRIKDTFRYRLLIKSTQPAQKIVEKWLATTDIPTTIKVHIDVDPTRL